MDWVDQIRVLHVLGATVLIGTGSGIAFFMVMAHRSGDPSHIAQTASIVVVADMVFTATAAVLQPITGAVLMWATGWPWDTPWVLISLALYVFIGLFWLPVVWIQAQMRNEARLAAAQEGPLTVRYHRLYRIWFACGIPAFLAILALLYLMVIRPDLGI